MMDARDRRIHPSTLIKHQGACLVVQARGGGDRELISVEAVNRDSVTLVRRILPKLQATREAKG